MEHMMYSQQNKKKKHYIEFAIFFIFIIILALLIIPSFYSDFSITGSLTEKIASEIKPNSTIKFSADLTIPNLEISGVFQNVELKGSSESFIYIESEKFRLNSKNNYIVLKNYTGDVSFNNENILALGGKSSKVFINGIPVEPKTKSTLKVSLESFNYGFLVVEKEAVIKKITYVSSGSIRLNDGKNVFNIENEEVSFEDFMGNLKIENGKLNLEGYVKNLDIKGKQGISVSSQS